MSEVTRIKSLTFNDIVNKMVELREEGQSAIVKRENFRDYPEITKNVQFGVSANPFSSFGYIERLYRKLAVEYDGLSFDRLHLIKYREACGYFAGEIEVTAEGKTDLIDFAWEGKGDIENTWDNFTEWQRTQV